MFDTIRGFEQLLTGAHRKPAPVIRPPVLVWHLAFWGGTTSAAQQFATLDRSQRKEKVDIYLQKIFKRLHPDPKMGRATTIGASEFEVFNGASDYAPLFERALDRFGDFQDLEQKGRQVGQDSQVVTFRFLWWGLRVTLRFEFHTEYLTLSSYIDLSTHQTEADFLVNAPSRVGKLYSELKNLDEYISADHSAVHDPAQHNPEIRKKYEAINQALYFDIWQELFETILHTNDNELGNLGLVFADFRGLVLGRPAPETYSAIDPHSSWANFQQPFWRRRGGPAPHDNDVPENRKNYWQAKLAAFWPLLTVKIRGVNFARYEFTASQMLNGRALYVTALGPQPPVDITGDRFPLCYFIYTHTLNGWQIGRLVDRINHLGTVRLAALIQLQQLRDAALAMSDCERKIKSAFAAAHQVKAVRNNLSGNNAITSQSTNGDMQDETLEKVHQDVRSLESDLKRIEAIISAINEAFGGDVEYRIERSRYYVRQFRQGFAALRIGRIEGFQPYNVFIERRLGAAFDSIDLLGVRYQRVRVDIASLFQLYLAHETRAVEIVTRDQNKEIERIQAIADIALFVILIPYYGGNLLDHILYDEHTSRWLWIGAVLAGASIWLWRATHKTILRWLSSGIQG